MKNILSIFLIATVALLSCNKDDDPAFDQSPDERLNQTLSDYQQKLAGAENGWKAFIYPKAGGTFFFYFKFDNQNRVKMYSTFDSASAVTLSESSYRLKALQQPSLIFDTYSYVHVLADPNESSPNVVAQINGGDVGTGLASDFEFYFDSISADTLKFIGRFNGSEMIMVRATKQEADAYNNKDLGKGFLFQNLNKYLNYFKRVTIGGVAYEISVNQTTRTITFSWLNGGNVQSFTTPFFYSGTGVSLVNPLVNGSQTVNGFTNLTWDAATTTLGFSVNGTQTTVVGLGQPLKVDIGAPQRWWQYAADRGDFWISVDGFHVNGVDNAFRIDTLTNGANISLALIYWPAYNTNYDFFGPLFLTPAGGLTLAYGTAPDPPTFTTDGRAIFTELGNFNPHPATGGAALTRAQLYNTSGYYFVQTSATSYDMVGATDGKVWITWEF
jgi:hypothetical protein